MISVTESTSRSILTPCGLKNFDFQVDPYIGCEHLCYYCYVLSEAETDWSKEVRIHKDITGRLSEEMDKIPPRSIYMGYYTDPYQPCEGQFRQTQQVLELFAEKGFSAGILTKSDLVVRDMDVLKSMKSPSVSVSVAFTNNQVRRLFEANTMDTEKRIDALALLKESGIKTGTLICPVIPYISDAIGLVEMLEPCADEIWIYGLSINDPSDKNWLNVEKILREHFSDQAEKIKTAVFDKNHPFWADLKNRLEDIQENRNLNMHIHI